MKRRYTNDIPWQAVLTCRVLRATLDAVSAVSLGGLAIDRYMRPTSTVAMALVLVPVIGLGLRAGLAEFIRYAEGDPPTQPPKPDAVP